MTDTVVLVSIFPCAAQWTSIGVASALSDFDWSSHPTRARSANPASQYRIAASFQSNRTVKVWAFNVPPFALHWAVTANGRSVVASSVPSTVVRLVELAAGTVGV